jgi:hypothetical protein
MSSLPLFLAVISGQSSAMNQPASHMDQPAGQQRGLLRRIGSKIAQVVDECAYAQRRMAELTMAPDRYMVNPDTAPDTYAEFLFRTSGALRHEPAADRRAGTAG